MDKLLTIVIPTYNMEAYLERCLQSLVVPTELMNQLEVLVINDGSKDCSSKIAHGFEAKYPQTYRVIDKENGNYGSCVNRGLKEATGKYIKVLDADDWFDTEVFSTYLTDLHKLDVDMVLTPFCSVHVDTGMKQLNKQELPCGQVLEFNNYPSDKIYRYSMHMVTYRTELLRSIDYHQTEGISYTDTEWAHIPQYHVQQFVYLPYCVYQYMVGREGQTMDASVLAKNIWKYEIISKSLINNRKMNADKENTLADEFNLQQIEFLASNIYRMMLVLVQPTQDDLAHLKDFDAYLKQECPIVYKRVGQLPLKKFFPMKYVRYWRLTGCRFSVDFARDLYRKVRYGK